MASAMAQSVTYALLELVSCEHQTNQAVNVASRINSHRMWRLVALALAESLRSCNTSLVRCSFSSWNLHEAHITARMKHNMRWAKQRRVSGLWWTCSASQIQPTRDSKLELICIMCIGPQPTCLSLFISPDQLPSQDTAEKMGQEGPQPYSMQGKPSWGLLRCCATNQYLYILHSYLQ